MQPKILHTDNDKEFKSKEIAKLCESYFLFKSLDDPVIQKVRVKLKD